jgi:hypothetical protein
LLPEVLEEVELYDLLEVEYRSYRSNDDEIMKMVGTAKNGALNPRAEQEPELPIRVKRITDNQYVEIHENGALMSPKCRHPYIGPVLRIECRYKFAEDTEIWN